jgi:ABC-type glycerol-3-phosphate transport system substrate-binding protein
LVAEFNAADTEYKIKLVNYDDELKFTTDITVGNIPDIIVVDALNFNAYVSKGIFEDLNPFITKSQVNLVPSIKKALETDGKLYRITSAFGVMTMLGSSDYVGSGQGWTFDEMYSIYTGFPEGTKLFPVTWSKEEILTMLVYQNLNEYIDRNQGTAAFNSENFKSMLEFVNTFPDTNSIVSDELTLLTSGKQLVAHHTFTNFDGLVYYDNALDGKVVFKGFPGTGTSAGVLYPLSFSAAVTSGSTNKEGAWKFLQFALTNYDSSGFSTKLEKYEQQVADAMFPSSDETPALTDLQYARFKALLDNVDTLYLSDPVITNIIDEEISPYFAGQKSIDAVCDIIQSRVQIYVSEQR